MAKSTQGVKSSQGDAKETERHQGCQNNLWRKRSKASAGKVSKTPRKSILTRKSKTSRFTGAPPPLMSSSVVTFKISRMFSLNLKPGIRLDIKKEQVKTHANLLKVWWTRHQLVLIQGCNLSLEKFNLNLIKTRGELPRSKLNFLCCSDLGPLTWGFVWFYTHNIPCQSCRW